MNIDEMSYGRLLAGVLLLFLLQREDYLSSVRQLMENLLDQGHQAGKMDGYQVNLPQYLWLLFELFC